MSVELTALDVDKTFSVDPVLQGATVTAAAGSVVALLGPSGCGKTTLLRIIAGLEHLDGGEILIDDTPMERPGIFVAPEKRRIGLVFQDWALFPHMSVARNVGFGLPRAERKGPRVDAALEMVGLSGLGARMPDTLSGGQQQRVALARAVAPEPAVLLMDEPFSNLDTALRVQVRSEVHRLLLDLGITTVIVTHDQQEAFLLGDEVAVMSAGKVLQQGTPAELYESPVDRWVASFVGEANLLPGTLVRGSPPTADTVLGPIPLRSDSPGVVTSTEGSAHEVEVLVRPEDLSLRAGGGASVDLVEYYGHDTVYVVATPSGPGGPSAILRSRISSAPQFRRGDAVQPIYRGGPALAFQPGDKGQPADGA